MSTFEFTPNNVLTVDIHRYTKIEAKEYLEKLLKEISPEVNELIIIHGFNHGRVLQNLVRKELKSKRIKRIVLSLNDGITTFIL